MNAMHLVLSPTQKQRAGRALPNNNGLEGQGGPLPRPICYCGEPADTAHAHKMITPEDTTTTKPEWPCSTCGAETSFTLGNKGKTHRICRNGGHVNDPNTMHHNVPISLTSTPPNEVDELELIVCRCDSRNLASGGKHECTEMVADIRQYVATEVSRHVTATALAGKEAIATHTIEVLEGLEEQVMYSKYPELPRHHGKSSKREWFDIGVGIGREEFQAATREAMNKERGQG